MVLVDCRLVDGDEYVLLQRLAADSRLPIIGLGTDPGEETIAYLRQLGVKYILRDPIRPSVLFDALVSVLALGSPIPHQRRAGGASNGEQPAQLSGHILVAEDNYINQMYVLEMLQYCGCTCEVANNGDEALTAVGNLTAAGERRYDLVLMDCQMPELDGFGATREIRRREAANELPGRVPIIALTANALKGDRERCLDAGMDDYLSKPVEAHKLQATLAKWLSGPPPLPPEGTDGVI